MNIVHCKECGKDVETTDIKYLAFKMCPECKFWHDFILLKGDPFSIRINGKQFWIGSEDAHPSDKAFGGQAYSIKPLDKRSKPFKTTNLNYCGDIPLAYLTRLPDNAVFAKTVFK